MKVEYKNPPNYDAICKKFDIKNNKGVVFTYGDTVYVPSGKPLTPDLEEHEGLHIEQQTAYEGGAEAWWDRYLEDTEFRLDQEIAAYGIQYKFISENENRAGRRRALKFFTDSLSGPIYGRSITEERAKELIQEAALK